MFQRLTLKLSLSFREVNTFFHRFGEKSLQKTGNRANKRSRGFALDFASHPTSCYYRIRSTRLEPFRRLRKGAIAQLGERLVRNEEVSGSIPLSSTISSTEAEALDRP
jgi:hypothetical protein